MTDLTQKPMYRSPSLVMTSEDLLNDKFLDGYLNAPKKPVYADASMKLIMEECALTNEDLDSYEFLNVPAVIPENAKLRENRKSTYGVNFIRHPEKVHYWKQNENTIRLTNSNPKEVKRTLVSRIFGILNKRIF